MSYFPTKKFSLKIDKAAVLKSGTVRAEDAALIEDTMRWEIDKNYLMKSEIMILDLIAHNNWQRPIYFAVTVGDDSYLNLQPYFQLEGLTYRIVPIRSPESRGGQNQTGRVNEKDMYNNMMNKFLFGNMNRTDVYLDQTNMNMTMNFRNNFSRLAETLMNVGKQDSAMAVLDKCIEEMPDKTIPYNVMMLRPTEIYYALAQASSDSSFKNNSMEFPEQKRKQALMNANAITKRLADIYEDDLNYYFSLKGTPYIKFIDREMGQGMAIFQELIRMAKASNQTEIVKNLEDRFKKLQGQYDPGS